MAPRAKKLSPERVDELCALYRGGSSTYKLAREFGIRRDQVSIVLKRAGVTVDSGPQEKLTPGQKTKIHELRRTGLSIRRIGVQFGVSDNTVIKAIQQAVNEKSPTCE